jgi:hypothetical protein
VVYEIVGRVGVSGRLEFSHLLIVSSMAPSSRSGAIEPALR